MAICLLDSFCFYNSLHPVCCSSIFLCSCAECQIRPFSKAEGKVLGGKDHWEKEVNTVLHNFAECFLCTSAGLGIRNIKKGKNIEAACNLGLRDKSDS